LPSSTKLPRRTCCSNIPPHEPRRGRDDIKAKMGRDFRL
jgi:hypothetical protein